MSILGLTRAVSLRKLITFEWRSSKTVRFVSHDIGLPVVLCAGSQREVIENCTFLFGLSPCGPNEGVLAVFHLLSRPVAALDVPGFISLEVPDFNFYWGTLYEFWSTDHN